MRRARACHGFTLLELMLVLALMGVLAGVAVRRVDALQDGALAVTLEQQLGTLRRALEVYEIEHDGQRPDARIARQLTVVTDEAGNPLIGTPGLGATSVARVLVSGAHPGADVRAETPVVRRGPYLRRLPRNPVNGRSTIRVAPTLPQQPEGTAGWIYALDTGEVRADSPGRADTGGAWWLM